MGDYLSRKFGNAREFCSFQRNVRKLIFRHVIVSCQVAMAWLSSDGVAIC